MALLQEHIIDAHVRRAVEFYGNSDTYLKYTAIAASPVVGSYDGTTKAIADQINRSPSTVENYAHAHWLYKELRTNGHKKRVRFLWRSLPCSHWWQAWDIHNAGYDAFYYLDNADLHSWSGRRMMDEYKADREAGNAPLMFHRAVRVLVGLVDEMLMKFTLSEDKRIALLGVQDAFEEA